MRKGNRQHKHRRKQTNKKWDVRMRGRGMIVCFLCWREKRKKRNKKKKKNCLYDIFMFKTS